jgi:LuxR family transcriptional regulator, maltose regulon positive regulatory protein
VSGHVIESHAASQVVADELLTTKLVAPSVHAGYVPRQRLIDSLRAGRDRRLTLVDAPTGYGKTMLVAAWCAELARNDVRAVSWLSLSAAENDPAVLTRYLIRALRGADSIGDRAEAMLQVTGSDPIAWMRALVNELAAASTEITLVLDDYHVVTAPTCHALVQFLLDHAPSSLHLIVCTREAPPITLGALRVAGQLAEIQAAELRFTNDEAAQLLIENEGLSLDDATIARVNTRTEGWAAGLYLAALWLRGRGGGTADVEQFAGESRHVVEYLSEVVLDQLGDDVREFLLMTSIVDRLSTSLCEAITDMPAAGMLAQIERSNVFLVPLDETGTWYRYHNLFGETLRGELTRRHPDLVPVIHRRASTWYGDRGLISEAIEHATAAGDYATAATLISEHWLEIGRWGQEATLRRWLDGFDNERLEQFPQLGLIGAFLTAVSGGPEREFRRWLALAEQGLAADRGTVAGAASLSAGVQLLRSAFGYHNVRTAAVAALQTARAESETDGVFRVAALANLAFLLYLIGDHTRARHTLSEAIRDPLAENRPYGYIIALTTAALIALDDGEAEKGQRSAEQALNYAETAGLAENQIVGLAHVALGRALLRAGRLEGAVTELQNGLHLLRGGVMPTRHIYALLHTAPALQAAGNLAAAIALTDEAEDLLDGFDDAGELTALLHDVRRRLSFARKRRRAPDENVLTDAEQAILRALRTPQTQRMIADQLMISINTVKTHTTAIYRKLGVSSREDAIERAIDLGLL